MITWRWRVLIFCGLAAFVPIIFLLQQSAAAQNRLETAVTTPEAMVRVIAHLAPSADLDPISLPTATVARRTAVIAKLQQTAVSSQADLRRQLDDWQGDNQVASYRPLWIINAIVITGTVETIAQIAARPDVAAVTPDAQHRYFDPPETNFWQLITSNQQPVTSNQQPISISWGIERINAPAAWHGLGIDGSGVTIAIMDTGVDWLHPDLFPNYRGNLGNGGVNHAGNWFHARYPGVTEPVDPLGHGTHVAGTAVGQNGIGVAPGAKWIAVSIADELGFIYESEVHLAFEWLMAPNGDPALAPDIVNNSWGGNPYAANFVKDVAALQAAGIIAVFAAGNAGPFPETVGSPASYTGTLSIAASDDIDAPAWFSSRGPSPLTAEQKPWIAAPGVAILSALPGGAYGAMSGTSMATPHVVGAIALLLEANPSLARHEITDILAETAVPIAPAYPNNDSGWGRLDAYAAVRAQTESGILQGVVRDNGAPLPGVSVAITTTDGSVIQFQTDAYGRYQAGLRPGSYSLSVSHFGYTKTVGDDLIVASHQTTTHDITLTPLPAGTVSGVVRQAGTDLPLAATITVPGTPVTTTTDDDGRYELALPPDQYKLLVEAPGHRLGRATILPQVGQATTQDFTLETGPTILLVDGGKWYFSSYADYYQDSLAALNRSFDTWAIRDPFDDVPAPSDLEPYDVVIWSNPLDSPGYVGAGGVISDYLDLGGNLLVSGQHVGAYDGQGFDTQIWWYKHLGASYAGKTAVSAPLTGTADTLFAGMSLILNGEGSANNQTGPDQSRPRANTLTRPTFAFDDGLAGGLQAGHCQPFRIAYFGFGLEGAAANERADILNRSFDYFAAPPLDSGLQWDTAAVDDFALAGDRLVYTLTLRNMSEVVTDTFQLTLSNATWPAALLTDTLTLGACQTGQTVVTIDVPEDTPVDVDHQALVTAVSANNPALSAQFDLNHKTPGHILLVDDDRWYDQEDVFAAMLDAMHLSYDVWDIGWDNEKRGSPPQAILNAYDIILWYTAYDWFAPVTADENEALTQYLAQGGRLFLTSQDFLFYHYQTPLARQYLGVAEYQESVEPRFVYGAGNHRLAPDLAGPLPLDYGLYQNFSDSVVPALGSEPFLWLDGGMAGGTATAGAGWRTIFLSFPLEKMPTTTHAIAMNSIVGWLSDLGESSFVVDRRVGQIGEPRTYTITLRNLPTAPANQVAITNTLPATLTLLPETITGGAIYNPATRQLTWAGELAGGAAHQISYQAAPDAGLADGSRLDNALQIYYGRHDLVFNQIAPLWVNAPDLSGSTLTAVTNAPALIQRITYTLRLVNEGQRSAEGATAVVRFSEPLTPVVSSLATSGGAANLSSDSLMWDGDLAPGQIVTVTLALERDNSLSRWRLPATAVIDDQRTPLNLIYNQLYVPPYTRYFPLIARTE